MCSRTNRLVAVCLTLLFLSASSVDAQDDSTSSGVAILDAVMQFRVIWLADTTPLATCSAYAVLGRPADFPAKFSRYVVRLLDQDTNTCDRPADERRSGLCPVVHLEKVVIADSVATVDLMVSRGHYRHRQIYAITRSRLSRSGKPLWDVGTVTLTGIMHVNVGTNPGDVGPNGPICPGHP